MHILWFKHGLEPVPCRSQATNAHKYISSAQKKLDVRKLQSQRTAASFHAQLSDKLRQQQSSPDDIGELGANIFHALRASAEAVVGFERLPKRNQWHDEERRVVSAAKNDDSKRTLQSVEDYRQRRREERRLIRPKKREQVRRVREEIEMYRSRNDVQKFFKNVKRLTEGLKPQQGRKW